MNTTLLLPRPRLLDELVGFSKANLLRRKWRRTPRRNATLDEALTRNRFALRRADLSDCLR